MATFKELLPVLARAAEEVQPGCNFTCDDENEQALRHLLAWASGHRSFFGDLGKGLMLMGSYGTGKTLMMRALQRCVRGDQLYFTIHTTHEVATAYNLNGTAGLQKFMRPKHLMFDDLGAERLGQHYGDRVEVMQQIIEERYDLFLKDRAMTHLTTNLTGDEILARYGHRMYSRLRHMHNTWLVGSEENATDRRATAKAPERAAPQAIQDLRQFAARIATPEELAQINQQVQALAEAKRAAPIVRTLPTAQSQWEREYEQKIRNLGEGALTKLLEELPRRHDTLARAPFEAIIRRRLAEVRSANDEKTGSA